MSDGDLSNEQESPKVSMLEVSQANTAMAIAKDYGSESKRKNEFIVGIILGVICVAYAVFVFVIQIVGLFWLKMTPDFKSTSN